MIVAIVIIAVTFLVVVGVMLAYWPKGISVNENDEIQLSTYIGKPQLIPINSNLDPIFICQTLLSQYFITS